MSKTAEDVGLIAAGVALMVATYGAGTSATVTIWGMVFSQSTLFAVGLSAGISGAFGLLQSILNPNDTSVPGSQQNASESAAFRRVVYGNVEVSGVRTYDSSPAGNGLFQDAGPQANWRHMVFTITGHQITSFGRGGIMCVIIDNIYTELQDLGNGLWVPSDPLNPWAGNPGDSDETETPLFPWHIAFEFDVGNPSTVLIGNNTVDGDPFPNLAGACADWGENCCQVGCAKVHVAMRYDYYADGSEIQGHDLATFQPIYVNGYVPNFRFPVTGKPLIDTRTSTESPTTWAPDSFYVFANYIIDAANNVEWETNGPGGSFESGPGPNPPTFAAPGYPTDDNECIWLNAGPIKAGSWPGPEQTIQYPYTFRDPNGNLQTLMQSACGGSPLEFDTGPTEPTWATQPGQYTPDGATIQVVNGLVSVALDNAGSGGTDGTYTIYVIQPGNPGGYTATLSVVVSGGKVSGTPTITNPGYGYVGLGEAFQVIGSGVISPPVGFPTGVSIMATVGVITQSQQGPAIGLVGAAIGNPGSGFTSEPLTFPVYDSSQPGNPAYAGTATVSMVLGGGVAAPFNFQIGSVVIDSPGQTYTGNFSIEIPEQIVGGTPATLNFTVGDVSGGSGQNPQVWLCLGVPTGGRGATNMSNPALIIYDYLTNTDYGMSVDPSTIDIDSINAMANLCEETVVVTVASNNGTLSENLYNCDGVFDMGTPRGDVLKALVASCAGILVPPGDLWHLFGGQYTPPTVTLTDADLRDSIKADFRISRRDMCNGVKGTFMPSFLPTNTTEAQPAPWRWTDFPPYQANGLQGHPDYLFSEDSGQIVWKDTKFGFCTSIWQAQRLAKITLMLLRFQVSMHLACKLTAFQVQAGDTITFIHARWAGLTQPPPVTFLVTQATITIETKEGAPTAGIDLVLRETDPSIYEFAAPTLYQAPNTAWVVGDGEYSQYGQLAVY